MAACRLHDEDQVCVAKGGDGYLYGLVLENSEYVSSDEESDAMPGQLRRGTVRVAWHPNGTETVVEENKVNIIYPSFLLKRDYKRIRIVVFARELYQLSS